MCDYLPQDAVTEILIRLPVKSILRFRCVCKEWCNLISSPSFIANHLSLSSSSPSTLIRLFSKPHAKEFYTLFAHKNPFNLDNYTLLDFPFYRQSLLYFRIVRVCNGLLCLSEDLFKSRNENDIIIIWNPSIRRAITLPRPLNQINPSMSALGFGFDSVSDDYKVVRVNYNILDPENRTRHEIPPTVEVLSLSSCVWRTVENNVGYCIGDRFWSQICIYSVLHWVGYKMANDYEYRKPFRNSVVKFDLRTERFGEMDLPNDLVRVLSMNISVTMVNGLFCVLYNTDRLPLGDIERRCVFWVMKEYGNIESWTPLYALILEKSISRVLGVKGDGEIVLVGDEGELISYNSAKGEVSDGIQVCGSKHSFYINEYAKSLVLLGKGKEIRGSEPEPDYVGLAVFESADEMIRKSIVLQYLKVRIAYSRLRR